jgi:hypothetical protein
VVGLPLGGTPTPLTTTIPYLLSYLETLPVYIRDQNAGLLITKESSELRFEAFELLATDDKVVGTVGRLERLFQQM